MRAVVLAAAGAMALSACAPTVQYEGVEMSGAGHAPLKHLAALDCPAVQGELTRTAQAPDGRWCDYTGADGRWVRLRLLELDGRSAQAALEPTKAELRQLVPMSHHSVVAVNSDGSGRDRADIDLPFFHVHTDGDRADVNIFGIRVKADGPYADVKTNVGLKNTQVHAGPEGAEVTAEDAGGRNASFVYVLAADKAARSGWAAVGYVAKGPAGGPLVVGEFRSRSGETRHEHRGDHGDLDRLIDRNLKG
jgi:hypothetical protein